MRDELKPCPFCGGIAAIQSFDCGEMIELLAYAVTCKTCGAKGQAHWKEQNAKDSWDKRAELQDEH